VIAIYPFFNPVSPVWFRCSGTLLDETTFLTTGHCAFDIGTDGAVTPSGSGVNDVWETFDEVVNLESHLTGNWNVHTSNNPSPVNGQGGTNFGDSGGGVFLNDTNTVVAVVSFGFNGNCKGADYSARVDVPDAQDFILPFAGD
jgi:V8-like Glu-specific endopeptidase